MQVSVTGKQIDIGAALREYATAQLVEAAAKYFDHPIEADADCTWASGKPREVVCQFKLSDPHHTRRVVLASVDGHAVETKHTSVQLDGVPMPNIGRSMPVPPR
jgi:ribosome-associated translation inhibitor RaiA